MSSGLFKTVIYKSYLFTIYVCMYEQDLALNNVQELIYHKTQPTNQPTIFIH